MGHKLYLFLLAVRKALVFVCILLLVPSWIDLNRTALSGQAAAERAGREARRGLLSGRAERFGSVYADGDWLREPHAEPLDTSHEPAQVPHTGFEIARLLPEDLMGNLYFPHAGDSESRG